VKYSCESVSILHSFAQNPTQQVRKGVGLLGGLCANTLILCLFCSLAAPTSLRHRTCSRKGRRLLVDIRRVFRLGKIFLMPHFPKTGAKFSEAQFFLRHLEAEIGQLDRDCAAFCYYLSAFLAAGRSVTLLA